MSWNKIIECVPNFSEGRDFEKIDQIVAPFRSKAGVKLLDYSNDEDHNRLVVTLVGEPEALCEAVVEAVGVAVRLIDLNQHTGQHPRMGAVDVIPFIPIHRPFERRSWGNSSHHAATIRRTESTAKNPLCLRLQFFAHVPPQPSGSMLQQLVLPFRKYTHGPKSRHRTHSLQSGIPGFPRERGEA